MAPDPHDEGDFEGPDTRSLLDEFMANMAQSVNDDYKNRRDASQGKGIYQVYTDSILVI